ncbi:glycoside hydrolase family 16 protein [Archangium minus]
MPSRHSSLARFWWTAALLTGALGCVDDAPSQPLEPRRAELAESNLVSNPSFETGTAGWASWQGTLLRETSTAAPGGSYVARVTRSTGTLYSLDDSPDTVPSAVAGTRYEASASVAAGSSSAVGKPLVIVLRERNASGAIVSVWESEPVSLKTTFQTLSVQATVQQTGDTLDVYLLQDNAVAGDAFLADAVNLQKVSTEPVLLWSDEFDGPAGSLPNPAVWNLETGGMWDHGRTLQQYTARPENCQLDGNGHLRIIARRERYTGEDGVTRDYTSARIQTQGLMERRYGYVEVRLKAPTGKGTWPAAWMMGSTGEWPANGEFDLFEGEGDAPTQAHGTLHAPGLAYGWDSNGGLVDMAPANVGDAWHTFGMFWDSTRVEWYVDRVKRMTYTKGSGGTWVFDQPNYVLLNLALGDIGGDPSGTTFPQVLEVDYVRWYAAPPTSP